MTLAQVIAEQWLARRLSLALAWDGGVTSAQQRCETVRRAIVERSIGAERAGYRRGQPQTWAQVFQRTYQQPLQPE